jgi:hypothetical protein
MFASHLFEVLCNKLLCCYDTLVVSLTCADGTLLSNVLNVQVSDTTGAQ